jgi:DNA mismatch repair ATPase MutS
VYSRFAHEKAVLTTCKAGFPAHQLQRFLKILVQDLNKSVAISEEILNDAPKKIKSGDLKFDRKVTRIITPGTLIDESFMDPWKNNYLLSIHVDPEALSSLDPVQDTPSTDKVSSVLNLPRTEVGLAWVDLSSGDFLTQSTDLASLPSAVARIGPREIILDSSFKDKRESRIVSMLQEDGHVITYHEALAKKLALEYWIPMLEDVIEDFDITNFSPGEVSAGGSLLHYVNTQLQGSKARLQAPISHQPENYMGIDRNSLRALELRTTMRDGRQEGSLLHALKKTVTKSGTRLLTKRLSK